MKSFLPLLIFSVFLNGCGEPAANRPAQTNSKSQTVSVNANAPVASDVTVTTKTADDSGNSALPNANKKKRDLTYLPKIEFVNQKLGKNEKSEDIISGAVKNTGGKAVKVLSIRAVYLDEKDVKISESDFPVIYENAVADEPKRPLKPNESRKFSFRIMPPPNWSSKFKLYVMEAETEN